MRIVSLHRYPVKGLSPEPLSRAKLTRGGYFPGDRLFAIENGPSGFDRGAPRHQPKIKFLMLMRNEALARLRTRYDDESHTLTIEGDGGAHLTADLRSSEGRETVCGFMREYLPHALRGRPGVIEAPNGFRFTDSRSGYVSIINRASVASVEEMVGAAVHPLRFRGNLLVEGLAPWAEFDLVGQRLQAPCGAVLRVTKRIVRCAAVNVDPTTGLRDLDIPATLMRRLGHMDCGVYAEVESTGEIAAGDVLGILPQTQPELPLAAASG